MREVTATFHSYQDSDDLVHELAGIIARILSTAIEERGRGSLVVSGGSTPVPLFSALSRKELDWSRVWITLADERWVEPTSDQSNERLVKQHFLRDRAHKAHFVGLKTRCSTAMESEDHCCRTIDDFPNPDLLILGMGNDGHTASLFPDSPQLVSALDMESGKHCKAVTTPSSVHERMTLTLPFLLRAGNIVLHITGDDKLKTYQNAMQSGPVESMPIRAVLRNTITPVAIYWAP